MPVARIAPGQAVPPAAMIAVPVVEMSAREPDPETVLRRRRIARRMFSAPGAVGAEGEWEIREPAAPELLPECATLTATVHPELGSGRFIRCTPPEPSSVPPWNSTRRRGGKVSILGIAENLHSREAPDGIHQNP